MIVHVGAVVVTYVSVATVVPASATTASVTTSTTTVFVAVPTGGCFIVWVDGSVSGIVGEECIGRMSTAIVSVKRTMFRFNSEWERK